MGKEYTEIDERLQKWIGRQHVFFVATAPLDAGGLVNCSPKGLDSLRVLGPTTLAYVDVGGSGIETVAHLKENGRIVIMMRKFSAFTARAGSSSHRMKGLPRCWHSFRHSLLRATSSR